MTIEDANIILEHALSSRVNLSLAIDVADAYDELRKKLITEGMQEVERLVRTALGSRGLHIDNGFTRSPLGQYVGLFVRHEGWLPGVHVGVEAQTSNGRNVILGVKSDPRTAIDVLTRSRLNEALGAKGKTSEVWPWYMYLDAPYQHWDSKEALLTFFRTPLKPSDAASYLSNRITWVAQSVSELLAV